MNSVTSGIIMGGIVKSLNREVTLKGEYNRYLYVEKIIDELCKDLSTKTNREKAKYEARNITERMLLGQANYAVDHKLSDPVLNIEYDYKDYCEDIKYQIKKH